MCGHFFNDPVGTIAKDVTGKSTGFGKEFRNIGDTVMRVGDDIVAGVLGGPLGAAAMGFINTPGNFQQQLVGGAEAGGAALLGDAVMGGAGDALSGALSSAGDSISSGASSAASALGLSGDAAAAPLSGAADTAGAAGATAIGDPIIPATSSSIPDLTTAAQGVPNAAPAAGNITDWSNITSSPLSTLQNAASNNLPSWLGGASSSAATAPLDPAAMVQSDLASSANASPVSTASLFSGSNGAASGAASAPSSLSQFMSSPSLSTAGDVLASNPAAAVSALGLGKSVLSGNTPPPGTKPLSAQASAANAQAQQLQSYLSSGKLPPGMQQAVDAGSQAAIAGIRQQYSAAGLSGSTMETQAINAVRQNAANQVIATAQGLYEQGASEAQISAQLYEEVAKAAQQQNEDLNKAIGNFAASLSGAGTKSS